MSGDWGLMLAPVVGLAADVVAQIAFARLTGRFSLSMLVGVLVGLAITAVGTAQTNPVDAPLLDSAVNWVVAILTFLALSFGFWTFLNLNITSLRIRMLREILKYPGGIARDELMTHYSIDEFLKRRLERLSQQGQVSLRGDRWRLESGKLLTLARLNEVLRAFIRPEHRPRTE